MTANRQRPRRAGATMVALVLISMVLAGCGTPPNPTEDQIVGTWLSTKSDGWGEPGGSIVFHADGTFVARGVPEAMLIGNREATAADGEGTWTTIDGSPGSTGNYFYPGVRMTHVLEPPRVLHNKINFVTKRDGPTLMYWNNYDLPERYILTKQ